MITTRDRRQLGVRTYHSKVYQHNSQQFDVGPRHGHYVAFSTDCTRLYLELRALAS